MSSLDSAVVQPQSINGMRCKIIAAVPSHGRIPPNSFLISCNCIRFSNKPIDEELECGWVPHEYLEHKSLVGCDDILVVVVVDGILVTVIVLMNL